MEMKNINNKKQNKTIKTNNKTKLWDNRNPSPRKDVRGTKVKVILNNRLIQCDGNGEQQQQQQKNNKNKQQNKTKQLSFDCDEGAVDCFSCSYPHTFTNSAASSSKSLFTNTAFGSIRI